MWWWWWWWCAGQSDELSEQEEEDEEEEEEEALEGEEGQEKVVGEEEAGGGAEWEGLCCSGRRASDKEVSALAILEERVGALGPRATLRQAACGPAWVPGLSRLSPAG